MINYLIKRKYIILEKLETPKFITANGKIFTKEDFKESLVEIMPDIELSDLLEWIKSYYASGAGGVLHLNPYEESCSTFDEAIDVNSVDVASNAYYSTEVVGVLSNACDVLKVLKYNLNSNADKLFLEKIENSITLPEIKSDESVGGCSGANYFTPEYLGSTEGLLVAAKGDGIVSFKDSEIENFLKELDLIKE